MATVNKVTGPDTSNFLYFAALCLSIILMGIIWIRPWANFPKYTDLSFNVYHTTLIKNDKILSIEPLFSMVDGPVPICFPGGVPPTYSVKVMGLNFAWCHVISLLYMKSFWCPVASDHTKESLSYRILPLVLLFIRSFLSRTSSIKASNTYCELVKHILQDLPLILYVKTLTLVHIYKKDLLVYRRRGLPGPQKQSTVVRKVCKAWPGPLLGTITLWIRVLQELRKSPADLCKRLYILR